jgi:hypothetical protein
MKFRKKPVVIDAIQWTGANLKDVIDFTGKHPDFDKWFDSWEAYSEHVANDGLKFKIFTLEGTMTATPGDWIIRGVQGECYPCKPDIFEATYDQADSQPAMPADSEYNIEAAARELARRMDYPWEFMNHRGRINMREITQHVLNAASRRIEEEWGMIQIEHENVEELKKWGMGLSRIIENCFFCHTPTRYWNKKANQPCCPSCSKKHKVSEFKEKK